MPDNLPPLSALRAFEAAARRLSFTRAAEELGMTQAAVSYQIKVLEERIGAPLFHRRPRQVELSEAGLRLAPGIADAFELMRTAVAATRHGARSTLAITSMHTFAANWLVRHLGSFQLDHPTVAVRLDSSANLVDFNRDPFDVGIRWGLGSWAGLEAHLLFNPDFTILVSPQIAKDIRAPADILTFPLLHPSDNWWPIWLKAAGLGDHPMPSGPDVFLDSQAVIGSTAIAGKGIGLLSPAFFADELANGQLVQPFDLICTGTGGYYLVYPEARRNAPAIRAFRDWLLARMPPRKPRLPNTPMAINENA